MPHRIRDVVVVDDDADTLYALVDLLTMAGLSVAGTTDPMDVERVVLEAKPAVIVLDVLMPLLDGYEVARQLKANCQTRDIPIIFLTGLTAPEAEIPGLMVGAHEVMTKPPEAERLIGRIRELIARFSRDQG